MRTLVICGVLTAAALGLGLQAAAASLPYQVSIDREGPEEDVLEQISAALTTEGRVAATVVNEAMKGLDRYIDTRVEKDKKQVTLYPQTIFEVAKACGAGGWSGGDIRLLLVHMQTEIDTENRSATKMKRLALAEITRGKMLKDVIAAMEEGEADDDR